MNSWQIRLRDLPWLKIIVIVAVTLVMTAITLVNTLLGLGTFIGFGLAFLVVLAAERSLR